MRTRDWRRAQKFRMRARAERVIRSWYNPGRPYPVDEFVRHMADNMQSCSCEGCGNPRRHFKELTIQEKKQNEETDTEATERRETSAA